MKFEVNVDVTCGAEQSPSGPTSPRERTPNGTTERSHRHHKKPKTPEAPSGNPMFDKIHQLEKRFKHFLKLTTEKLDEQKATDNRHYSDLKNDISSMEKQIERSARNSAVEIVESLSKELENTMKKWTKVLNRRSLEGPKDGASSDSSSGNNLDKSVENGVLSARSVSSENSSKPKTQDSDISGSIQDQSIENGAVKMREAIVIGSNSESGDVSKGSSENGAAVKSVGSQKCTKKCDVNGCGQEQPPGIVLLVFISVQYIAKCHPLDVITLLLGKYLILRLRSPCSLFVLVFVFLTSKLSVHFAPFLHKNGAKFLRFCPFTLDPQDYKYGAKDIRFCAFTLFRFCQSHC